MQITRQYYYAKLLLRKVIITQRLLLRKNNCVDNNGELKYTEEGVAFRNYWISDEEGGGNTY